MARGRHRASKGLKVSFAAFFLLGLVAYQKSGLFAYVSNKGEKSVLDEARYLQSDAERFECSNRTDFCGAELDDPTACFLDEDLNACCRVNDETSCITADNVECEIQDICVAQIIPGSGSDGRCLARFERERAFSIIFYLALLLYLFLGLAIICDDYFVPCLEKISDALDLSDDVAGATFMAAGSSAPELFVSLSDNIFTNPPQNLGTGAVVGGGIFNVLVIIGLSAAFAGQKLNLNWRPFARDYIFYVLTVILLVVFVLDEEIQYYEGLLLFLFYLVYVTFMYFNSRFFIWLDKKLGLLEIVDEDEKEKDEKADIVAAAEPEEVKKQETLDDEMEGGDDKPGEAPKKKSSVMEKRSSVGSAKRRMSKVDAMKQYSNFRSVRALAQEEQEKPDSYFEAFKWPDTPKARAWYILTFPLNVLFRFTVPDCRFDVFGEDKEGKEENRKWGYSLGFAGCIVWIGILSHILVFATTVFGCLIGLDAAIMGLTLLAVGTNVPDALSSVLVAKNGKGDMAVSNAIGSNVFDILVGLGFPWFIAALAFDEPVPVAVDDLTVAVIFLIISLLFLFAVLMIRKWTLDVTVGVILLTFYVVYVLFELFVTPQIIGDDDE